MRTRTKLAASAAAATLAGAVAFATPAFAAAFTNGSVETGTDPGTFATLVAGDTTTIPSWSVDSGSVDYIGSYWQAADGVRSLDMNGLEAGSVSQSFDTVPGASYSVTFSLSGNPDSLPPENSLWSPGDKVLRVSATGAAPADYHFDTVAMGNTKTNMMWQSKSYSFTATGSSTTLTFASQIVGAFGPALDNVAMVMTAPPACFVSTGGHGLGYWSNKNGQALESAGDFTALTSLNLVKANGSAQDFTGTLSANKTALNSWILGANATNMAYMLSAQLAAVQLSVAHGAVGTSSVSLPGLVPFIGNFGGNLSPAGVITINNLIAAANASLGAHPNTPAGSPDRAYQEALKNALEQVASGASVQLCQAPSTIKTFTASDSSYYNGPTSSSPLYGTGPITFTWDSTTGNVTGGLYEEIVPPTAGTHYFNNITGTMSGNTFSLNFSRTVPNSYAFTGTLTLSGNTVTGTLDGPYFFTATGAVTP